MRGIDGIGNLILLLMAAASLISMIAAFGLQGIVSNNLSSYGLKFSYNWAIPYWNTMGVIFAMGWLNIIAAVAFQIYRIRIIRKEESQSTSDQSSNMLHSEEEQENQELDWIGIDGEAESIVIGKKTPQEDSQA
jgi:membrane-bound ClpP family serine protease